MNIYWFTGRSFDDLCATTQIHLGFGLARRGYNLTIINQEPEGSHAEWPWNHQSIPAIASRGLRSWTLAKNMRVWLLSTKFNSNSIAMVDWGIATKLVPIFRKKKIPWILIDRSPPADPGFFSLLQWPIWKKSWRLMNNDASSAGCVVSDAHRSFVTRKTGVSESIVVLPAGVDLIQFQPGHRFETLTLVYHGRLDRHRGVMALPMLVQKVNERGMRANLLLIGSGDAYLGLEAIAKESPFIDVKKSVPRNDLASILSKCHVGLLPMPATTVWRLASPLKRSEYLAAGLLVLGIDHAGHRLEGVNEAWYRLLAQEDFLTDGVAWLKQVDEDRLADGRTAARTFAESFCSWNTSVEVLESLLQSFNHDA